MTSNVKTLRLPSARPGREHSGVDNICHTLVGAALARTGLKRRTSLGAATMMIGANFPDIDILSAPFGRATEFRRGWTHGILALVVLPFVLAGLVMLWDRYFRKRFEVSDPPVVPRQLLLLAAFSIWTHPVLDWMNSYGLRWLMPFDGHWFYGDSLFIIDPYLLVVLGLGVLISRGLEGGNAANPWWPARVAIGVAAVYMVAMFGLQNLAERTARQALLGTGYAAKKLVVTPSPAKPFSWRVHADDGSRYRTGNVSVLRRRLTLDPKTLEKNADDPAVRIAVQDKTVQPFLDWARLPFFRVDRTASATIVRITDARYGATVAVSVR